MAADQVRRIEAEENITVDGADYRLRFDFNVMADFEGRTGGRSLLEAISVDENRSPTATDLRLVFELCLQDYHEGITARQAGRIYSADPASLMRLLAKAFPAPAGADETTAGKTKAARAA